MTDGEKQERLGMVISGVMIAGYFAILFLGYGTRKLASKTLDLFKM